MKLLDTSVGNTKLRKTAQNSGVRYAGLSLMPNNKLCPGSKAAGCFDACLKSAGRGAMSNVAQGRQRKTDLFMYDRDVFLFKLKQELRLFDKLCTRKGLQGVVRLNVLSDVPWEDYGIPDMFSNLRFLDYTKMAHRLHKDLPSNYNLIFSYSARKQYEKSVQSALQTDRPIAVVFSGGMPDTFLDRPVIDGDKDDWENSNRKGVIIGLKAKGKAVYDKTGFVVNI